jgi:hypothetical protein
MMIDLVDHELRATDWKTCSTLTPGGGGRIPAAVRALLAARSSSSADAAYWQLDNHVVVQGQLFGAALPLVPVLLAALGGELAPAARLRVADLLVEITCGTADESEARAGNGELGQACRAAARAGLWLLYALLRDADAPMHERVLQILYAVDDDRSRVSELLTHLASEGQDARVRAAAAEFQGYMPGVIYDGSIRSSYRRACRSSNEGDGSHDE